MKQNEDFLLKQDGELWYYSISSFEESSMVKHGFSTRKGGVSVGECSTLNLGFKRNDSREAILENFEIFTNAIGIDKHSLVFTDQIHEDKIAIVGNEDCGKGIYRDSDLIGVDGLITNQPGVALVTFYADCVPLFFLDTRKKVIALSHSGWRGTVAKIGAKTLEEMNRHYGTLPEDCLVAIGPSIGPCCFEVDAPVANEFMKVFPEHKELYTLGNAGKYYIDLWKANFIQINEMGVLKQNISMASLCTLCNKNIFFSHRGDKGRTGSMAAILMLV